MLNSADIIKQLKDEIDKEGGDGESLVIPKEEVIPKQEAAGERDAKTAKEVQASDSGAGDSEESAAQAQEGDDKGTQDGAADEGEDVDEEGDENALSADARKRNKAFGAMRAELREAKERADKLELARQEQAERLARLEGRAEVSAPQAKAQEDAEPDALLYPDDHNQWQLRQIKKENAEIKRMAQEAMGFATYQKEERGVQLLEETFKTANPKEDYDGAQKFLIERERKMKQIMNPKLTDAEADAQTRVEKVQLFKTFYARGENPAQKVIEMAKAQGFVPGAVGVGSAVNKDVGSKTNLNKIAENQRKSANLMGGSPAGKSKTTVSSDDVLGMGFSKLMKLSTKERERLAGDSD